jgi:hypothetical protein
MGGITTSAALANLLHVVINGSHESVGRAGLPARPRIAALQRLPSPVET